ncbi:MAG: cell wall-binding repeat-containing protein, partial [Actinobacteria bacterium]|nr:cell wall-binding repeat-containing protein [Actinomycetota bacterium]
STYPVFDVLWTRLAGADRFDTMECIVEEGFDSADTVIIATGFNYPDALAASGLAGGYNAPILLTDGTDLSPQAGAALLYLNPSHAIIVGGEDVVSSDVALQIEGLLGKDSVTRASGTNRVETAIAIFNEGEAWSATAIIATGYGFADALSISPFAYATKTPIFLTGSDMSDTALSQETIDAILSGGFTSVILVGGEDVVSEEVKTQLGSGYAYERLSGIDRYQTSAAIADFAVNSGVLSYDGLGVATGANFPDALAGGAFCGEKGSVLLLADDFNDECRYCIDTCITDNATSLKKGYLFGGDDVVTLELEAKIMTACRY